MMNPVYIFWNIWIFQHERFVFPFSPYNLSRLYKNIKNILLPYWCLKISEFSSTKGLISLSARKIFSGWIKILKNILHPYWSLKPILRSTFSFRTWHFNLFWTKCKYNRSSISLLLLFVNFPLSMKIYRWNFKPYLLIVNKSCGKT
jgi:hypothetical protein